VLKLDRVYGRRAKGFFFTRQLTGWLMPKIALKLLDSCLFFVYQACNIFAPKWRIICSIYAQIKHIIANEDLKLGGPTTFSSKSR